MCHIVHNVDGGAEMRSRFWLGHVSARKGDDEIESPVNLIGNSWLNRRFQLNENLGKGLFRHATEEMAYLAEILSTSYAVRPSAP